MTESKPMRGVLIDPAAKTVTEIEVDYSRGIDAIYEAIGAQPFDVIQFDSRHACYIDDEGLYRENQAFWQIKGYPSPIAGKALFLNVDAEGETRPCDIPLSLLNVLVSFPDVEFAGFAPPSEHVDPATGMFHIDTGRATFRNKGEKQ